MLIPGSPLRAAARARLGVGPQAALSILRGELTPGVMFDGTQSEPPWLLPAWTLEGQC